MKTLLQKTYFIALCIFLVNLAFKCINLTAYPLWYDEVWGVYFFQGSYEEAYKVSLWDVNPPFFSVMLCFWIKKFGISEFAIRMFPVLFSSASGVMLYLFIKRFFDQRMALVASLLYLASSASFFFAHEARGYTLILFMSISSTWLVFEMIRQPRWWHMPLIGGLYYGLFMTHFLTAFLFVCHGIMILATLKWKPIVYYGFSCLLALWFFEHFLDRFIEIFFTGERTTWLWHPSYEELWKMFCYFNNGTFAFLLLYSVVLVSLILFLRRKEQLSTEQKRILIFAFMASVGVILVNFIISSVLPMFLERYLFFTLIGFILITSFFIAKLPLSNSILFSGMGILCLCLMWNIDTTTPKNMDYRKVVAFVNKERDTQTDVVLQANKILFSYYFDREAFRDYYHTDERLNKQFISVGKDSSSYRSLILPKEHKKMILVQTYENIMDPDSTLLKRIWQDYRTTQGPIPFEGAQIWVFERKVGR